MKEANVRNLLERGAYGIGTSVGIDLIKNNILHNLKNKITHRYGREIFISNSGNPRASNIVREWVKEYKTDFKSVDETGKFVNDAFIFKLDDHTYCYAMIGDIDSRSNSYYDGRGNEVKFDYSIKLYIFGRYFKKYSNDLIQKINAIPNDLWIYNVSGNATSSDRKDNSLNSVVAKLQTRDIDTLFYRGDVKDIVCTHIENFEKNKNLYDARNINYKTGILLYGEPGTGKTSLATALATKYNYSLIVVDMTTFETLDTTYLAQAINADSEKYIILLEDIDTLYNTLSREDKLDKESRKVVNKMIQFLDSNSSPKDVIFIATTNNIDALDEAIIRDGRFDLKVKVGSIDKVGAKKMISSFDINEEGSAEILTNFKDNEDNINQSTLQKYILEYYKTKIYKEAEI